MFLCDEFISFYLDNNNYSRLALPNGSVLKRKNITYYIPFVSYNRDQKSTIFDTKVGVKCKFLFYFNMWEVAGSQYNMTYGSFDWCNTSF